MPDTATGRRLLAHELVHVVQQEPVHGQSLPSQVLAREPATPEPSEEDRLAKLEDRLAKVETSVRLFEITAADKEWQKKIDDSLSSCNSALLLISSGLIKAQDHFKQAQVGQAEYDNLVTQLLIAGGGLVVAGGFEPAAKAAAGAVGLSADLVEYLENPIVQFVGSTADIVGPISDVRQSSKPTAPSQVPSGSPIGSTQNAIEALSDNPVGYFLDSALSINENLRRIDAGFLEHGNTLKSLTNSQLQNYDPKPDEDKYSQRFWSIQQHCKGIENMKSKEEVATILERHLWAIWIRQMKFHTVREEQPLTYPTQYILKGEPSLGSYIAAALNNVGFGGTVLPEVKLATHFYQVQHQPANWAELIRDWASSYNESITK